MKQRKNKMNRKKDRKNKRSEVQENPASGKATSRGNKKYGGQAGSYQSQPRKVAKQYWRQ